MRSYIYETDDLYGRICFRSLNKYQVINHLRENKHRHGTSDGEWWIRRFRLNQTDREGALIKVLSEGG